MNIKRIRSSNREENNKNMIYSSLIKIIINHFQFFSFLRFMNFKWDIFTTNFLTFQSYFGDVSESSSSSIDCLIDKESFFYGLYFKIFIFSIFPFFVLLIICFWVICKKNYGIVEFTFISIISLDLINPSVINTMIESITCYEFEGNFYLRKDMSYQCYTPTHIYKVGFFELKIFLI